MTKLRQLFSDFQRRLRVLGRSDDSAAVERLFWLLRAPARTPGTITWRNRLLHYADAPSLYYQLADIYVERVYDFACDTAAPRILDVGGHVGIATRRFRELFPQARIHTFEPDPALAKLMRANLAATNDTATTVIEAAAWTSEGTTRFAASGDASGMIADSGTLTVPTIDLARYCEEPIDFLKLDVEGAEFGLIAHLGRTGALARVRRLYVELHEWTEGIPRFHEVLTSLVEAGFNYRLRSAQAMGDGANRGGFSSLRSPANLAILYAWRR